MPLFYVLGKQAAFEKIGVDWKSLAAVTKGEAKRMALPALTTAVAGVAPGGIAGILTGVHENKKRVREGKKPMRSAEINQHVHKYMLGGAALSAPIGAYIGHDLAKQREKKLISGADAISDILKTEAIADAAQRQHIPGNPVNVKEVYAPHMKDVYNKIKSMGHDALGATRIPHLEKMVSEAWQKGTIFSNPRLKSHVLKRLK